MQTTILGTTYEGRPMIGSLALRLHHMEERGDVAGAQALLDAHKQLARGWFGNLPGEVDLQKDMTPLPQDGLLIWPAVRS